MDHSTRELSGRAAIGSQSSGFDAFATVECKLLLDAVVELPADSRRKVEETLSVKRKRGLL